MTIPAALCWPAAACAGARGALAADLGLAGALTTEQVTSRHGEVPADLRRAAPLLVDVDGGVLAVRRAGRKQATLVAPTGRRHRVRTDTVVRTVRNRVEAAGAGTSAGMDAAFADDRLRRALESELMAGEPVALGERLVPSLDAPVRLLARRERVAGAAVVLLVAHVATYTLFLATWAVVGGAALAGGLTPAAVAWFAVLLALLVPTQLVATWSAGATATRAGAVLKRRLLGAALHQDPDTIRDRGAGRLLGWVLEAEALQTLALSGGHLGLLAAFELAAAATALAVGARPGLLLLLLGLWVGVAALAGRSYLRRRTAWTDGRLALSERLVEQVSGHRTRRAQDPRGRHDDPVDAAEQEARARGMDRAATLLTAVVPRGWTAVGVAALLLPQPPAGEPIPFAVSLGGVLLAFHGLRKLSLGVSQLAEAVVAWGVVGPLVRAPTRPDRADPVASPLETGVAPAPAAGPLLDARGLAYRHHRKARPTFEDVDLQVWRGERILLAGPSGVGKSTLAATLAGLRAPQDGVLHLDRLDGRRGARVLLVPQFHENHVLSASLAFNLLLGHRWPPAPPDLVEAEQACRAVGLGPVLDEMPAGLQQMVGETGWQLSHGERSRLAVARALLQRPDLLIVDETLAALDPDSALRLLDLLLDRSDALLVIAHR